MSGEFEKPLESEEIKPKLTEEEKNYLQAVKEGPIETALNLQKESQRRLEREKQEKKSQKNRSSKRSDEQTDLPL